jgi:hypothetical protein
VVVQCLVEEGGCWGLLWLFLLPGSHSAWVSLQVQGEAVLMKGLLMEMVLMLKCLVEVLLE